ncbi:MAG: hypothetical protein ACQEP6_00605, partial [Patescibacteria group bacterium]
RHACSLIAFAEKNRLFSEFLRTYIDIYLSEYSAGQLEFSDNFSKSIVPEDIQSARERTMWLLNEISLEEEKISAGWILKTWQETRNEPQDVVLGIVGLAIIGPTLGIVNKKKKVNSMQIIFSKNDLEKSSTSECINLAHSASMKLISNSLELVDGDFHRLEPDLQYWFISDQSLSLGVIKNKNLLDISKKLNENGILHYFHKNSNGMSALCISPAVRFNIYNDLNAERLD